MYYIYEHVTLDGVSFYIGKGTKTIGRSYGGYQRAYSKCNRNKNWKTIAELGYKINIIEESENLDFILQKEDELWQNCKSCTNKQTNKKFNNFKLVKINDTFGILFIFKKTYIILNTGDVYNYLGKKLKLSTHNNKYYILSVSDGTTFKKNFYVHRLVAELFINNLNNESYVNHIDLNRQNNNILNLEWCTQKENVQHSVNKGSYLFKEKIKKILQFDSCGNFIKEWDRCNSVATFYNCTEELIQQACQQKNINKGKTAKNYIWIYKKDYEDNNRVKFNINLNKINQ